MLSNFAKVCWSLASSKHVRNHLCKAFVVVVWTFRWQFDLTVCVIFNALLVLEMLHHIVLTPTKSFTQSYCDISASLKASHPTVTTSTSHILQVRTGECVSSCTSSVS